MLIRLCCKSSFFCKHKIFVRFASGIKFANSFCRENIIVQYYSSKVLGTVSQLCIGFRGIKHVFLQTGFASLFQDPKSAKISCNKKSKTEKSQNFMATNIRWFTVCSLRYFPVKGLVTMETQGYIIGTLHHHLRSSDWTMTAAWCCGFTVAAWCCGLTVAAWYCAFTVGL